VAAFDPAGRAKDAMAVVDTDPASSDYGRVVGWSELPTVGNELHHFGWNACSSALCHQGHGNHGGHGQPLERRYLIVPGIRSSRTYVLDTKPDPLAPTVVREIPAEELAAKAGYSRPHTIHFMAPADCTVAVNDGSATAATAAFSGYTVSAPPPSTTPSLAALTLGQTTVVGARRSPARSR
jgi:hypothetical protein